MRKMILLLIFLSGSMIVNAQGVSTPDSKENKNKGGLDSRLIMKFEASLDPIEKNFKSAISSSDESDWMKEYTAKLAELNNNARDLQNEIMKFGIAKDCNMPKYVIIISEALIDCRKAYKNGKFDLALLGDSRVSINNSPGDILTKTAGEDNRRFAKGELALKSSYQDFKLAVAHLRENTVLLNKAIAAQKEIKAVSEKSDNGSVVKQNSPVKQNMSATNNATIYVICDNTFTFCVNGKEICSSDGSKEADLVITKASIKKGDVITVKCVDFGMSYGFACVVKFKDNKNIVSDTKNWKSYTPRNNDSWFDVNGIQNERPAMLASNRDWKNSIVKEANVDCDSIWGERRRTCYLVYEVKDEFNKELSVQGNRESAQPTQKDIDRLNPEKSVTSVDIGNSSSGKSDVQLITLKPEMARVGWANLIVGKDIKESGDSRISTRPVIDGNVVKEDYLYAPAPSVLKYKIPMGMKYFQAKAGTFDGKNVSFRVSADDKTLFESKSLESLKTSMIDVEAELPVDAKMLLLTIDRIGGGNAVATWWAFPKFMSAKPSDNKSKAVGKWSWPWGTMLLAEDGKATWINGEGPTDRATSWTEKDGIVSVTWADGHVDTFKYNPAGTKAVLTESGVKQSNINKIDKK